MSVEAQTSVIDELCSLPPYGLPEEQKRARLLEALHEAYRHHFAHCPAYRRYCERRGLSLDHTFADYAAFPYLPVQAFKENGELLASVDASEIKTRLQSSATSGVPSTVLVDKLTAKRQVRALASVIGEVLGQRRRPFLVLDVDPRRAGPTGLGARGAAVRGFLNLAREARYFMQQGAGGLTLDEPAFLAALEEFSAAGEPVCVFGFTFVLYINAVKPLLEQSKSFKLPPGSQVIHIGGWKKLVDQGVARDRFNADMHQALGVPPESVVDFYGFTEQMGVTYPDSPSGLKCAPAFAEVVVRDPTTFEPVPDGQEGLLEFLTPLPHSYPGIAVLTDDVGVVVQRGAGPDGWQGTHFRILGRAKKAEVRGCGDIMSEKVARPRAARAAAQQSTEAAPPSDVRLLFDGQANYTPRNFLAPIDLKSLPQVEDLPALADRLKAARARLDDYTTDEIIALIGAAARRWAAPDSPLGPLRQQGLQFLSSWCQAPSMRNTADRSLRGARGFLDGFRPEDGSNRRLLMAEPRGLVSHWLAGNVPLLGMLALAQSMVTRNANLLKAASTFSSVLPALLETFRGLEIASPSGRVLRGDDLLAATAVIYFPRDDQEAAAQLSQLADVRLAWGGREAIESVLALPRRYGSEDIIFGPKLSFMVIGRERLATPRLVKRTARGAATDSSVFDQYACASPHTIFVERGGAECDPRGFAERLAEEMAKAAIRIPKAPIDSGTAAKVESARIRYELTGDVWRSSGTEWTVLYDELGVRGLAEPCYSRVITVRAIDDVLAAADFAHHGIQTVGLALDGPRRLEFARRAAAHGAERFPDLGRMTFFDSPWDGLFPMDRFVRWVSLGGPF